MHVFPNPVTYVIKLHCIFLGKSLTYIITACHNQLQYDQHDHDCLDKPLHKIFDVSFLKLFTGNK